MNTPQDNIPDQRYAHLQQPDYSDIESQPLPPNPLVDKAVEDMKEAILHTNRNTSYRSGNPKTFSNRSSRRGSNRGTD
ncbi:hypothetical protein GOV12_05385 [Candidatus Pacearchaeota archaeon]|nr:hypothetical protein [Candidatus Pacearchaeota archaeon]